MSVKVISSNLSEIKEQDIQEQISICPQAKKFFRYTPQDIKDTLTAKLADLPHRHPCGALHSFQTLSFSDTIFRDREWDLYATRYFFEGLLAPKTYATLMLFAEYGMQHTYVAQATRFDDDNTFTSLDAKIAPLFRADFIESAKNHFPVENLLKFYNALKFGDLDSDSILVLNPRFLTPLMVTGRMAGVFFQGTKGLYILTPQTIEKFMRLMETTSSDPRFFRSVNIDYVHGALSPVADFEDPTIRPVYLPHPRIPNPPSIHGRISSGDGMGIYLHDLYFHILTQLSHIPLEQANVWVEVAKRIRSISCDAYDRIVDFSLLSYNSFRPLESPAKQMTLSLPYFTHYLRDDVDCYKKWKGVLEVSSDFDSFDDDEFEHHTQEQFDTILTSIPDLLAKAGVRYTGNGQFDTL